MRDARTPYDERPFYCAECGAGFGEFLACELPSPPCRLESERRARRRQRPKRRPRRIPTPRLAAWARKVLGF